MTDRYVIAKMTKDWVHPYCDWTEADNKIPVVQVSNHPRFVPGTRFDWGFLQVAIGDGYIVTVLPAELTRANCKHHKGFDHDPIRMGAGGKEYAQYSCQMCGEDRYIPHETKLPKHLPTDYGWADP